MVYTMYEHSWSGQDNSFESKGYKLLASIDEGHSYEVDQTAIYVKPDGTFAFATASGCSCWSGDWDVQDFDTLDDIDAAWTSGVLDGTYNPSAKGYVELMTEARQSLDL